MCFGAEPSLTDEQDTATKLRTWVIVNSIRSPELRQCLLHKSVRALNARTVDSGKVRLCKLHKQHVETATKLIKANKAHVVGAWVLPEELATVMPEAVDTKLVWSQWETTRTALLAGGGGGGGGGGGEQWRPTSSALRPRRALQCCNLPTAQTPPKCIYGVLVSAAVVWSADPSGQTAAALTHPAAGRLTPVATKDTAFALRFHCICD